MLFDSSVRIDSLALLLGALIVFIGSTVVCFASRYMDGDQRRGQFLVQLGLTALCALVTVTANSLALFALGWIGTSIGLVALQLHYRERAAARRTAALMGRTFIVGDVAMTLALIAVGSATHSSTISSALDRIAEIPAATGMTVAALLAVAAFSKSAQMPFHRWLPETLEAPTPVSALMHAGIVNAGGYLFARFSPIFITATAIDIIVFALASATAIWGAACLLVRSDIKRTLAYSTMSQMGYMTLQCALGAYAAAVVHLTAHGVLKAAMFLGSGRGVSTFKFLNSTPAPKPRKPMNLIIGLTIAGVSTAACIGWYGAVLPSYVSALAVFAALTAAVAYAELVRYGRFATLGGTALALAGPWLYAVFVNAADAVLLPRATHVAALPWWCGATTAAIFSCMLFAHYVLPPFTQLRDRVYVWLLAERLPTGVLR